MSLIYEPSHTTHSNPAPPSKKVAPAAVETFLPLVTDTLARLAPEAESADAPVKKKSKKAEKSAEGEGEVAGLRRALASALAVISGHTTPPPPRSMISSQEGYQTYAPPPSDEGTA